MLCTETSGLESDVRVAKSEDRVSGQRDFGFKLCIAPFPNIDVPNFKLEDLCQSHSEVVWSGWRFRGSDVLDRS